MNENAHHNNCQPVCPFFRVGDGLQPLLKVGQTADILQVSPSYVYKLIDKGKLQALLLPVESKNGNPVERRVLRIRIQDLQEFLSNVEVINGTD